MKQPTVLNVDQALTLMGTGKYQYILLGFAGLAFSGDAIEISLLSFLSPCVRSNWNLSNVATATLASTVFGGAMIGSIVLGPAADIYGRRVLYLVSTSLIFVFGVASAFAWNYLSLLIFRSLVGVGIGGGVSSFNLLAELIPPIQRGRYLLYIEYFWTLGSIYTTLIAYFTLSHDGWRVLTGLCALPVGLSLIAGFWLPESPRWLLLHNKPDEARNVIMRIAKTNQSEHKLPLNWELQIASSAKQKYSCRECVMKPLELCGTPALRRRTSLIWIVWIIMGFCYYGLILMISRIYSVGSSDDDDDDSKCSFDSLGVVFSSASEVVGLTFVVFTIDPWGRKGSQAVALFIAAFSSLLLGLVSSNSLIAVFAFLARGSMMACSSTTWAAIPELYPTYIRTTGNSMASVINRIGAFSTAYVVESSLSVIYVGLLFGLLNLISLIAVLLLPETSGKSLDENEIDKNDVELGKESETTSLLGHQG